MAQGRISSKQAAQQKRVLSRLAKGETLSSICKDKDLPASYIIREWVYYNKFGFADSYFLARDMGLDAMADQCIDIADQVEKKEVARDRLRIQTRQWVIEKAAPRRFKFLEEAKNGGESEKVSIQGMPEEEIADRIEAIKRVGLARIRERAEQDASDLV